MTTHEPQISNLRSIYRFCFESFFSFFMDIKKNDGIVKKGKSKNKGIICLHDSFISFTPIILNINCFTFIYVIENKCPLVDFKMYNKQR